jgi:hypothetical protein
VVDVTTDETKTGGWEGVQLLVGIEAVVVMLRLFAGGAFARYGALVGCDWQARCNRFDADEQKQQNQARAHPGTRIDNESCRSTMLAMSEGSSTDFSARPCCSTASGWE